MFQLPASRVKPVTKQIDMSLRNSSSKIVHTDKRSVNHTLSSTQTNRFYNVAEPSQKGKKKSDDVTVLVPELEQLGIRRPGKYCPLFDSVTFNSFNWN